MEVMNKKVQKALAHEGLHLMESEEEKSFRPRRTRHSRNIKMEEEDDFLQVKQECIKQ